MKMLKTCKTGCGKMKSGGTVKKVKKMADGGQIYGIPQTGPTGPNYQGIDTMKKGGMVKKMAKGGATSFGMLSVKAGVDKNPKPTAADRIVGAKKKAKFGASVPVQHSPAPGRVRSSSGVGTVPVGTRKKMGGTIRKKK